MGVNGKMEQVIFTCLTPGNECEWFHLKDFVAAFNDIHHTSYARSKCIDVYGPANRQPASAPKRPEVMIEAEGQTPIVIERKAVVWPPKFQRDHSKEHYLPELVGKLLGDSFLDAVYQLRFCAEDLRGKKLREVDKYGKEIAGLIMSNEAKAKSQRGIRSRTPVKWRFRPLTPHEIYEPNVAKGVSSLVDEKSMWDKEPAELSQNEKEALSGFAERFEREASRAGQKYDEYAECQKLFVVQFFGESELVTDEEIIEIIKAAPMPKQIDQVWLTGREWVSQDDYELAWERVR